MLTSLMNSFNDRFDKLRDSVTEIRVGLEFSQVEIASLKDSLNLQDKNANYSSESMDKIKEKMQQIENSIDYLEYHSRRNNVIFNGVDECVKGTWQDSEKKVLDIIEKTMDLRDITIDRAHRIGKARSQARPIVVKFLNYKDREQVLKSGKCLKGTPINVRGRSVHKSHQQKKRADEPAERSQRKWQNCLL